MDSTQLCTGAASHFVEPRDDVGDDRWQRSPHHDPARELSSYLLSRPGTNPRTLFGGLVNHQPDHLAQLRDLLESDLATITRCLATLDELAHLDRQSTGADASKRVS